MLCSRGHFDIELQNDTGKSHVQVGALMQFALIVGGLGLAYCLFFVIQLIR